VYQNKGIGVMVSQKYCVTYYKKTDLIKKTFLLKIKQKKKIKWANLKICKTQYNGY